MFKNIKFSLVPGNSKRLRVEYFVEHEFEIEETIHCLGIIFYQSENTVCLIFLPKDLDD